MKLSLCLLCLLAPPILLQAEENSTLVPASRISDEKWKARHEELVAKASTSPELVFIGDSITELLDHPQYGGPVFNKRYLPLKAVALGVSADRIQNVSWRLQNGEFPDTLHPKVVVLLIGTNNIYDNSPDQIAEGINAITQEILRRSPNTKILLLGVLPRGEKADNGDRPKVTAMNQSIAKLANQKNIFFLDFGALLIGPDGTISKEILVDGIHPSTKGYGIWADAVQPTLDTLLKSQ